ncbi:hypothetical protein [Leuconostoc falkenbergense]|uniref:hypothetical protein n=1 Tax=Leuconostoc falkenbergense TaxID=2766470 RepID=UPI0024A7CB1D|nr:hypothetical protein [Leuconostoc falkenbergense]MDI6554151.1 hypothetical protein [Leuconostoc falkenbergense]
MQRKAHLLFLPASRRVRGEFEREHPLIYGVKLTQLAGLGSAHGFIRVGYKFENQGARERILRPYYTPLLSAECQFWLKMVFKPLISMVTEF